MKKFVIENDFWSLFPDAKFGIIVCEGIDNSVQDTEKFEEMLKVAEKASLSHLKASEFSSNPVVQVWREAFQKFKTKKGARSSIEALLKRVQNGNHIGTINPLVDIYNAISLKYALPCGGEDIDTFEGDLRLTLAVGDEDFMPLGAEENSPPYPGEVIYKDEKGAVCRCWNWREAVRTMLTEKTHNAFMIIESVDSSRESEFEQALEELSNNIKGNLGGNCKSAILDRDNREVVIK